MLDNPVQRAVLAALLGMMGGRGQLWGTGTWPQVVSHARLEQGLWIAVPRGARARGPAGGNSQRRGRETETRRKSGNWADKEERGGGVVGGALGAGEAPRLQKELQQLQGPFQGGRGSPLRISRSTWEGSCSWSSTLR